jgi:hypothetical protein
MSMVLERRRENWRGVRRGVLLGAEGKMEMWSGLFYGLLVKDMRTRITRREKYDNDKRERGIGTFLPITPRQAIDGIVAIAVESVGCWS